jgi:hypothetical protein
MALFPGKISRVQFIHEIQETEIESKQFELHQGREDVDFYIVVKDVQLQQQVRAVTEEWQKSRPAVSWLQCDLSQVREAGRRNIVGIRTIVHSNVLI